MLWTDIQRIRNEAPLVHNITNYVVMNQTANALLALGASPVMAHAPEEVEEMVSLASALVLNMGTLSSGWVEAMMLAGRMAKSHRIPIVFDPVGSGATAYRTRTARMILDELRPEILRGNASEIRSLVQEESATKGVDSVHGPEDVLEEGRNLSRAYGCVVSISGPIDIVVNDEVTYEVRGGHPIMTRVTGMGCTATAITAAFASVNPSSLQAAVHGMQAMAVAGELAGNQSQGPGSFTSAFIDALSALSLNQLETVGARLR